MLQCWRAWVGVAAGWPANPGIRTHSRPTLTAPTAPLYVTCISDRTSNGARRPMTLNPHSPLPSARRSPYISHTSTLYIPLGLARSDLLRSPGEPSRVRQTKDQTHLTPRRPNPRPTGTPAVCLPPSCPRGYDGSFPHLHSPPSQPTHRTSQLTVSRAVRRRARWGKVGSDGCHRECAGLQMQRRSRGRIATLRRGTSRWHNR